MTRTINYSLVVLTALALLAFAGVAYADDSATSNDDTRPYVHTEEEREAQKAEAEARREETKDALEQKREEAKNALEQKREEAKDAMEERREEAKDAAELFRENTKSRIEERRDALQAAGIENATERISINMKRFLSIIETGVGRIEGITARIESRMAILETEGVDTSLAASHLVEAKASLATLSLKLADIRTTIDGITPETARETFASIRSLMQEAKDLLHEAAQSVREAVEALKDAVKEDGDDSDSTSDSE
jgi:hypothetical protein